ncbi:MAG: hypothetical protein RR651_15370 [Lysinibacillus sp.]
MKWISNNKKLFLAFIVMILIIATLLDIKFEGLFFQVLPKSIQTYLADIF